MKAFTAAELDALADAYFETLRSLGALPGTRMQRAPHDTCLVVSGMLSPLSNGVCSLRRTAAPEEVAELADELSGIGLPWSIATRGEPAQGVLDVAAKHGLTRRLEVPLMAADAAELVLRKAHEGGSVTVRSTGDHLHESYVQVLTGGFGMPVEVLGPLARPEVLDIPGTTHYLVEADGRPVACGAALLSGGHVMVSDVATLPEDRGRGYGRLVTEAAVAGGLAAGAHTASLLASPDGLPLYQSMGFHTVESWTYLIAGAPEE